MPASVCLTTTCRYFLMSENQELIRNRRVLAVDDDPANRDLMKEIFEREKYDYRLAASGDEALAIMKEYKPALVVLDQDMPGLSGLETLKIIKSQHSDVDVIFVSAHSNPQMVSQALEMGADDYIKKPFAIIELVSRIHVRFRIRDLREELKIANEKLADLSVKDDLTGLFNMRSIYEKIEYELKRVRRSGGSMACVMFDMDHFKTVNDGHDHLFGSYVLKEMGDLLRQHLRETDFAARYGGDEFLVVLTDVEERGVHTFSQRLLDKVRKHVFKDRSDSIQLTLSLGYSVASHQFDHEAKDLVRCADHALYRAKETGRNRVSGFGPGATIAHVNQLKKKKNAA
jgi:two-component system cell cycle response regulator